MPGRVYHTEEEYRAAVRRDDETLKAASTVLTQLGSALLAAGAARWFATAFDFYTASWIFIGFGLIALGLAALRLLRAEG